MPLLTGEGVMNFFPMGMSVCPSRARQRCAYRHFHWAAAGVWRQAACRAFGLQRHYVRFCLALSRREPPRFEPGSPIRLEEMPESSMAARTTLIAVLSSRLAIMDETRRASVTAYHFTNSGQSKPLDRRSPPLEIHHIPVGITGFLKEARRRNITISGRHWSGEVGAG